MTIMAERVECGDYYYLSNVEFQTDCKVYDAECDICYLEVLKFDLNTLITNEVSFGMIIELPLRNSRGGRLQNMGKT